MASASFRSVGHVRPDSWSRGCYCKHDWPQADVLGCQIYRFLAPPCRCSRSGNGCAACRYTTSHIVHTRMANTPAGLACGANCGVTLVQFSGPTGPPHAGKVHTKERWPPIPLSQDGFSGGAAPFFNGVSELSPKGPV